MKLTDRQGLTEVEHRALKSVAVQFFVNGVVLASYVPRLPEIRDSLGVSLRAIGVILAIATGFGMIGSALQAPLITRLGTRRAMTVSSTVLLIGLALVGIAGSVWSLVIALAVVAISDVVTDVAMNMQGSALSSRRSTPVVNRLHGLWSLGTVIGGLIASILASLEVSLSLHLLVASVVLALVLVYVASGLLASDDGLLGNDVASKKMDGGPTVRSVLIVFLILGGAAILPEVITSDWAAFRLADDLLASNGTAGLGFVAFTAGMVVGRMSADAIVARLGSSKVLRSASLLATAGTVVAMLVPMIGASLVGLVMTGLGVSVMFPQLYDSAVRSPRSKTALGGLTAGSRAALLVAPLIVGGLADTDRLSVGFSVAVITIPAVVVVLVLSLRMRPGGTSLQPQPSVATE